MYIHRSKAKPKVKLREFAREEEYNMDQIFYHDTKLNKFYTNFHEVNLAPLFDPLYLDCLEWILQY